MLCNLYFQVNFNEELWKRNISIVQTNRFLLWKFTGCFGLKQWQKLWLEEIGFEFEQRVGSNYFWTDWASPKLPQVWTTRRVLESKPRKEMTFDIKASDDAWVDKKLISHSIRGWGATLLTMALVRYGPDRTIYCAICASNFESKSVCAFHLVRIVFEQSWWHRLITSSLITFSDGVCW